MFNLTDNKRINWKYEKLGNLGVFKTSSIDKIIKDNQRLVNLVNYMDVYKKIRFDISCLNRLSKTSVNDKQFIESNLKKGDILFTPSSETPDDIGHSAVIFDDLPNTVYSYHLVRFRLNFQFDLKFSNYFCNNSSVFKQMYVMSQGATRFTLSLPNFENIIVSYPTDLNEQQKIGSFFSAIDELIVKQNQKLSSLNEYYKYLLNSIFINRLGLKNNHNFVENALSKISVVKDGTHSSPTYVNDGYPLITSKNLMKNGKIEFKDLNYIAEHDFNEINKRSKVDKGDILFGMIGTLGNPVICENDNFAIKNVALIKAKPPLNSYLFHYLKSKLVLDQFDFLKTGGTQKFIALNKIRELKILLPNLEAQKKIGTFLNKIEELILKEEKVLNIYKLIKKYYLSEIFSKGE
jgi:type I restriction enzyme S subunit